LASAAKAPNHLTGLKMKRPVFIARQSARPSGLVGRLIASIMARETARLNEQAVELLAPAPTDRVLEIGFGHGRTIERIASIAADGRVYGLDVSEAMLNMAARRNRRRIAEGRVDLRVGHCATMPFHDASFDGALCVHTLYFWSDPKACLGEIRRVLRPEGRFVLGFLQADSRCRSSFPSEVYAFYDESDVREMLDAAGFERMEFLPADQSTLALAI
jgi:ubiquinone/menaquinone biosynthesis C-methylase UbiE